ncbi:MAG: dephospho-CoA kinase [Flavobacteriales bacterium]|nr:dephospho-CoA kinase [Flavobacteriales bacterium]
MKRIGIGAGKSLVAEIIKAMGYPVYNSDERAKELTDSNPKIKEDLIHLFGEEIYQNDKLNKFALAQAIFSLREKVNALIHPIVREDFNLWALAQNNSLVFNESAILFETGSFKNFDAIILVYAPAELRIKRIMKRDNCSENEVLKRMNSQFSDEEKYQLTEFRVLNDEQTPLLKQVEQIILSFSLS